MLNEFDIRDWERVDFKELDEQYEVCRNDLSVADVWFCKLYESVKLIRDKQVQLATKHVAAVEKAFKE